MQQHNDNTKCYSGTTLQKVSLAVERPSTLRCHNSHVAIKKTQTSISPVFGRYVLNEGALIFMITTEGITSKECTISIITSVLSSRYDGMW